MPLRAEAVVGPAVGVYETVRFETVRGYFYRIEASSDLASWKLIGPRIIGDGGMRGVIVPVEAGPYFRARRVELPELIEPEMQETQVTLHRLHLTVDGELEPEEQLLSSVDLMDWAPVDVQFSLVDGRARAAVDPKEREFFRLDGSGGDVSRALSVEHVSVAGISVGAFLISGQVFVLEESENLTDWEVRELLVDGEGFASFMTEADGIHNFRLRTDFEHPPAPVVEELGSEVSLLEIRLSTEDGVRYHIEQSDGEGGWSYTGKTILGTGFEEFAVAAVPPGQSLRVAPRTPVLLALHFGQSNADGNIKPNGTESPVLAYVGRKFGQAPQLLFKKGKFGDIPALAVLGEGKWGANYFYGQAFYDAGWNEGDFVMIDFAVGGTPMSWWNPARTGILWGILKQHVDAAVEEIAWEFPDRPVVLSFAYWDQGERDANGLLQGNPSSSYALALTQLVDGLRDQGAPGGLSIANPACAFFFRRIGTEQINVGGGPDSPDNGWSRLRVAQESLVDEASSFYRDNCYLIDSDDVREGDDTWGDGIHFPKESQKEIARRFLNLANPVLRTSAELAH